LPPGITFICETQEGSLLSKPLKTLGGKQAREEEDFKHPVHGPPKLYTLWLLYALEHLTPILGSNNHHWHTNVQWKSSPRFSRGKMKAVEVYGKDTFVGQLAVAKPPPRATASPRFLKPSFPTCKSYPALLLLAKFI
jgi:hypothetical protein